MLLAPLGQALPEAVRRLVRGERGGADRLAEEERHRLGPDLLQDPVEGVERRLARLGRSARVGGMCSTGGR